MAVAIYADGPARQTAASEGKLLSLQDFEDKFGGGRLDVKSLLKQPNENRLYELHHRAEAEGVPLWQLQLQMHADSVGLLNTSLCGANPTRDKVKMKVVQIKRLLGMEKREWQYKFGWVDHDAVLLDDQAWKSLCKG